MAVIDLRGPGSIPDSVARLGAAAASVITSIKGPDAKNRRAFFKRIEENPELFDEFGKIARDNPGALKNMFTFLKDEDIEEFRKTLPSLQDLKDKAARPAFTPVEKGGTLTPEIATALGEAFRAESVGLTAPELAIQPKEVIAAGKIPQEDVTAGAIRDVTGLTPGQTARDDLVADLFGTAKGIVDNLDVDEKERIALRAAIPSALTEADRIQAQKDRVIIAQMRIDAQSLDRANERTDAFQRSVAARWTKTGTPETWQLYIFSQEMNDRARGLADESIIPQNQTDLRLMEVAQAFSRADLVDKITEEAGVRTQIGVLIGRINRKDAEGNFANERSVRLVLLEQLNNSIAELSALTDGRISLGKIDKSKLDFLPFFDEGNLPLTFEDTTATVTQFGPGEIGRQRDQGVIDFLDSLDQVEQIEQAEQVGEIGPLNPETVDLSRLPQKTRDNLIAIMTGQGTFEELLAFDPVSAQLILDARRNR